MGRVKEDKKKRGKGNKGRRVESGRRKEESEKKEKKRDIFINEGFSRVYHQAIRQRIMTSLISNNIGSHIETYNGISSPYYRLGLVFGTKVCVCVCRVFRM